jgi:hypothetical protein
MPLKKGRGTSTLANWGRAGVLLVLVVLVLSGASVGAGIVASGLLLVPLAAAALGGGETASAAGAGEAGALAGAGETGAVATTTGAVALLPPGPAANCWPAANEKKAMMHAVCSILLPRCCWNRMTERSRKSHAGG